MTTQNLKFRFVPNLPTAAAWDNRPFREFRGADALFTALKEYEKKGGPFNYLSGWIRFNPGHISTYKDGTEGRAYNNPRWWKTGAKCCPRKCCTKIPEGETYDNTEPAVFKPKPAERDWQEFKRISGMCGAEEQFREIADPTTIDKIVLQGIGWFFVEP